MNKSSGFQSVLVGVVIIEGHLRGHCYGNFIVFWSKLLQHLTKNLFSNMKLLLEQWEENIFSDFSEEEQIVISF